MSSRPSSLACGLGLLMIALLDGVCGRPCPPDAVFIYSWTRDIDICVCSPGLSCEGPKCVQGENETPSFSTGAEGFLATCRTCRCVGAGSSGRFNGDAPSLDPTRADSIPNHPDEIFDNKCPIEAGVIPPNPRALHRLRWVHFPKCGTSLTSVIYNYACESTVATGTIQFGEREALLPEAKSYVGKTCHFCWRPCRKRELNHCNSFTTWAPHDGLHRGPTSIAKRKMCIADIKGRIPGHPPLTDRNEALFSGTYVGLFRDPRRRLISAFNYGRHAVGVPVQYRERLKQTRTLPEFASFNGIANCQTKMLMGYKCATQNVTLEPEDLTEAMRRVRSFAFVGITEYYTESVCLFHRMFGGAIHPDELSNLRPTEDFVEMYTSMGYTMLPKDEWKTLPPRAELYDWEIYKLARSIFVKSLERYGIRVPTSLREAYETEHDDGQELIYDGHQLDPSIVTTDLFNERK